MKVKTETALFEIPFGSHLYGTNGPSSDLDFKVVCLPALETLLLNYKVTNRKVLPIGKSEDAKMAAGEAEYEYVPLQIFLDDFFNGQTYALEIAYAVLQGNYKADIVSVTTGHLKAWIQELVNRFLTRNVSKMVGYAVSQSRNYGLKTERYTALKSVLGILNEHLKADIEAAKVEPLNKVILKDCPALVASILQCAHTKPCEILNGAGGTQLAPAIEVCGKQFPLTASIATVIKSLEGSLATYGDRVKKYDGAGIDWKALSHAIRITEQVIELSETGKFTFPRPNAQYLRDVKEGNVPVDDALAYLTECFNKVDSAVEKSVLQERTPELEADFEKFKINLLTQYYDL